MDHSPSHSALHTAATALRGIWAAVLCGFGLFRRERVEPGEQAVADWLSGILSTLENMLVRFQAGQMPAFDDAGAELDPKRGIAHAARHDVGMDGPASRGVLWGAGECLAGMSGDAHKADCETTCGETALISNTLRFSRAGATDIAASGDFCGAMELSVQKRVWQRAFRHALNVPVCD